MNDVPFIHLKTRSHYSILQSSITVKSLINSAIKYKMPAIALTDNCNLFGAMEFSQVALENGIQPINGSIVKVTTEDIKASKENNFEITLLVADYQGWKNLSKIVSTSYENFKFHKNKVIGLDDLCLYNKGLLALFNDTKNIVFKKKEYENIFSTKKNNFIYTLSNTFEDRSK